MSKRYYIVGYYGYHNAGDDAMLVGICDELNRRRVQYKFYLKGDNVLKVLNNILRTDVVALGGGTHLRNWGKDWLLQGLRIIAIGIFCRVVGKEFHMWNVGIDGESWEKIARKVSTFISIRDQETADNALLINWQPPAPEKRKRKIIGINITPVNTIYYGNSELNSKLDWYILKNICQSLNHLLRTDYDWTIRFISLNNHSKYSDEFELTDDVVSLFNTCFENCQVEIIPYKDNLIEVLNLIAECTLYIGMRYHANVFGFMAGVDMWRNYIPYSYPSVTKFRNAIAFGELTSLEQAKELARKGIKTD